jgi:signal transduction histidine kinase
MSNVSHPNPTSRIDLTAALCHELSQPLTAVRNSLKAAALSLDPNGPREREFSDKLRGVLELAMEAADHAVEVVRQTRDRLQESELPPAVLSLESVAETALAMIEPELRQRAQLVRRYDSVPLLFGRPPALVQAVLNLLSNALAAIPEDDRQGHEIAVSIYMPPSGGVVLEVADTGLGIPTDQLARVREPGFTTNRRPGSMGLGLAICERIVRKHGGRLEIESELGRGTRARMTLPLVPSGDFGPFP